MRTSLSVMMCGVDCPTHPQVTDTVHLCLSTRRQRDEARKLKLLLNAGAGIRVGICPIYTSNLVVWS